MGSLYYYVKKTFMFGEESFVNIVEPDVGGTATGFTVLAVDDKEITLLIDKSFCSEGEIKVTIPSGYLFHFEKMRTETEEIYGDEFETVVGNQLTIGYNLYATYAELDTLLMAGLDDENSIRVCKTDEEGNPKSRIAIYLLKKSNNLVDKKINKFTKRNFLKKYRAWMENDDNALSFLDKWEADGRGYEIDDKYDGYILRRMMLTSMNEASEEAYEEAYSDELPEKIINESLNTLSFTGFSTGGYYRQFYDLNATMTGNSAVYQFEDNDASCLTDTPPVESSGLYNIDLLYFSRYNMVISYIAPITQRELFKIHAEIVRRIIDEEDVQEYLDSLGFPIVVYYKKGHYDMLRPTIKNGSGKTAKLRIRYTEVGHNEDGEPRSVDQTVTVSLKEGYVSIRDGLGIGNYPRRNDYIKIEHIGNSYVDVRLPGFFDHFKIAAKYDEDETAHRIFLENTKEFSKKKTTTSHKYYWHSYLYLTLEDVTD